MLSPSAPRMGGVLGVIQGIDHAAANGYGPAGYAKSIAAGGSPTNTKPSLLEMIFAPRKADPRNSGGSDSPSQRTTAQILRDRDQGLRNVFTRPDIKPSERKRYNPDTNEWV